ncbi:MAG: class I SAM-dependent methyltransferase [Myxococcota bacterium]|nr:class I SAM-dependent methyltransferase [Myxococcota bacterium]
MAKFTKLDDRLYDYMVAHRSREDPVLAELRSETHERVGRMAMMQVAPEQGAFLELLVAVTGASRVVEVGTFTGYSSLCMARALPPAGTLLCCDVSEEWTAIARRYWQKAGVADKVELRLGPAADTLQGLPEGEWIDLAFIDADKPSYLVYYQELLARLRPGGLIVLDNVLWSGAVANPDETSESTVAIRAVNDFVAADERVESVMLAIADGITLARKR